MTPLAQKLHQPFNVAKRPSKKRNSWWKKYA